MTDIRWGILATGNIAADYARALDQASDNRLVAIASRTPAQAEAFAAAHGGVRAWGSYADLVADPDVDAIYVATPHPLHAEWTLRALAAGKAVLCEKPLGMNHPEVMAMQDAATQQGVLLMEAFMYRIHPQTAAWVRLIRDGAIGEVRHVNASFGFHARFDPHSRLFANALGGGGILDVGCYPVSAARLALDAEPERVTAHGRLAETGVDTWSAALLEFSNGVSAQVATSVSVLLDNELRIFGSRGWIRVANPWHPADAAGRWQFELHRHGREPEIISGQDRPLYVLEAEHFGALLAAGATESPAMSHADSAGNAIALDAWRRAIGLEYTSERPESHRGPLTGRAPRRAPDAPMTQAHVPGLDQPVSRLVMGCDNQPDINHASVMWDAFVEAGGNAFDTAWLYGGGTMETLLGHWLRQRDLRDQVVLIGKGAHSPECFPDRIGRQLTESLDRLQTDRVDIYFLHRDNPDVPVGEFVDALNAEVRAGRIRVFGGSNWSLDRVRAANDYAAAHGVQGFSAVSNQLSLARMVEPIWPGVESAAASAYREYLAATGTALMPWSAQARGFFTSWADAVLAGQGSEQAALTRMQPTVAELKRTWVSPENLARRARAAQLASERGVELIHVALAWVLAQSFPCLPLIGPRSLVELRSCLRALGLTLSPAEVAWLDLAD